MNKKEFLLQLRKGLSGVPHDEIEERLNFYCEMIEDRMEEGLSEEEAVCRIGNIDELISHIAEDIPIAKPAKEKITPKKRLKVWEIVLLVLGSPIWLCLGIAAFAVILSLYISLWSAIISIWTVFASLVTCALGGIAAGIGFVCGTYVHSGVAIMGAGAVCAGLSVFLFYGCMAATKGILILTKKFVIWIKNCFIKKEEA